MTAVRDVELAAGIDALTGLGGATHVLLVLRWRGVVVGVTRAPVADGRLDAAALTRAAAHALGGGDGATALDPAALDARREQILGPPPAGPLPDATVVVPTRDRPDDLARCLAALRRELPRDADLVVVDNAPSDDRGAAVAARYDARHVVERRPGLNPARASGARAARHPVVLYTDDDTAVEPGWYDAMRAPFVDPRVAAVCGLVLPAELETEAQELFETAYGGFVKRFRREVYTAATLSPVRGDVVGAGASMAVRRGVATEHGIFDVALDGGTPAKSGGDTYALYRVLRLGHAAVFTPAAVTRHRHRRTLAELQSQLVGYGAGTYAFLTLALLRHRERGALADMVRRYPPYFASLAWQSARRAPGALPWDLATAELRGVWAGVRAGWRASRKQP